MVNRAQILADNFNDALSRSEHESLRGLARASGKSVALLSNIANMKFNPNHGPGVLGLYDAAKAMGCTLNDFLPFNPTVQDFLRKHPGPAYPDTPIQVFGPLLPYCDIYHEPSNGLTQIKRSGGQSLLSLQSGLSDAALIQAEYLSWSDSRKRNIYLRQKRAWDSVKLAELDYFNEVSKTLNRRRRIPFFIGICRSIDFDGSPILVVFCEAMPD